MPLSESCWKAISVLLTPAAVLLVIIACQSSSGTPVAPDGTQPGMPPAGSIVEYVDPANRFVFAYPESFGGTSTGTNNGFGNRVSAVRFAAFSAAGIGGEAVLTQGPPLIDVQAVGGLYDSIVREALPDRVLAAVDDLLPHSLAPRYVSSLAGRTTST
jgi:hypothetical protein